MGPAPHRRGTGVGRPQRGLGMRACVLLSEGYVAAVEGWSDLLVTGGDLSGEVSCLCAGFLERLAGGRGHRGGRIL